MGDYSLDDLNAAKDVVWDFEVSQDLASKLDAAATAVENQIAPRNARKNTYGTHFQGYYSELWAHNIETANRDATLLASRLRDVAQGVRDLEADAKAEQERINAAREWKRQRDARSDVEKFFETVDFLHLFHGEARPPRIEPIPQMNKTYESPAQEGRREFVGNKSTGISSALPDDLRSFTKEERAATDTIRNTPATLQGLVESFRASCQWGQLSCEPVLAGFSKYVSSNDTDCARTDVVAANFEAAGGSGTVSSVSNDAIAESLVANGLSEQRPELEIPAVQAIGNPPSSGYANDPVNTATGNFVENEEDLRFEGATSLLGWARSYSSLSPKVGGHGPGWASFDGCGLRVADDGATWTLLDGREVFFPRMGDGFDRAEHENYWLSATDQGYTVANNTGAQWCFSGAGRPTSFTLTDGATVEFSYDGDRLTRIRHVRGHELRVRWKADRIVKVEADDGRQVTYRYEDGRLVEATGPLGSRRYEWGDDGLIVAVIDADGVVEVRNTYDDKGRVVTQISPFGRVTRFAYLPGRVTVVSDTDGTRSNTWLADARGRLVGITDSDGNRSSMAYDRWGNQVLATDPEGRVTARAFDERGRLTTEQSPTGARTDLVYDELDRLTEIISVEDGVEVTRTSMSYTGEQQQPCEIIDGEGGRTRMVWDDGLLLEVTDPTGVTVQFGYDSHGDLISSTDADGNTTRIVRDASGRALEMIKPSGTTTRFIHNEAGLLIARIDPDGARWSYEYSVGGRLTALVNPLGARTTMDYGEHGGLSATIDPLGRRVTQEFDDLGNVSRVQLPDGATWEFSHDAMSRLRQTIDPTGGVWQRHYDQFGRLNETVDPTRVRAFQHHNMSAGEITVGDAHSSSTVKLDKWGREVATVLPDGSEVITRYDRSGRPVEYVDAAGGSTLIERDPAGRPVRIRRPSGASLRYDYDRCGRVAGIRNELGFRTELDYDVDSQLVAELWPTGEKGWSRYDECGRLTARFSPGAGSFRWVHDLAGRVVETKDPKNGLRQFRYDEADQLVAAVAGNGGVTRYDHDANGRAVTVTDALGGVTRHTFDAMNRCTSTTDPLGATNRWTYDRAGRLINSVDADGHVVETAYDEAGLETGTTVDGALFSRISRDPATRRRTVEDFSDPARPVTHSMVFDPRGLLIQHDRGDHSTRWSYDADGFTTQIVAPNGAITAYRRDSAGDVVAVEHPGLATAVLDRDEVGRVTRATAGDLIHEWGYSGGFITSHSATGGGRHGTATMAYSDDGQLTSVTIDGAQTRYRYDDAAQMVEATTPTGVNTWTYDLAGRLVTEQVDGITWERTYNAAGQLLKAASGEATITYTYDHSGRRTTEKHSDGSRRDFEWTGLWRLASITDHHGDQVHRTTTVVDALGQLSRVDNEQLFFDHVDGGPLQVGDDAIVTAGPLTAHQSTGWLQPSWRPDRDTQPHNPYLPPIAQATLGAGIDLGPRGEIHIAGMEWLGARILDPNSRGFLSPDPLPPITGTAWAGNPYSYAGNNPANLYDPSGLQPLTTEQLDTYRKANSPKWGTALAIVAGVGLAFVPGAQGFAAALVTGAVLGGGASLIDQACSGYPIDWKQVGVDTLWGIGGGAAGWGIGKAFQWAAKTPLGQSATSWMKDQASRVPIVRDIVNRLGRNTSTPPANSNPALRSPAATPISQGNDPIIDLYRAVDANELADIAEHMFRSGPGLEAKQFGLQLEEVLDYATNPLGRNSYEAIVRARVPQSALDGADFSRTIDPFHFKSGVITVYGESMEALNQAIQGGINVAYR